MYIQSWSNINDYQIPVNLSNLPSNLQNFIINNINDLGIFDSSNNRLQYFYSDYENILYIKSNLRIGENYLVISIPFNYDNQLCNNQQNVFNFFDDFDTLNNWILSDLSYSIDNSVLTITRGSITRNLGINLNDNYLIEQKIKFNNIVDSYSGTIPSLSSSSFTQGGNSGQDQTILFMRERNSLSLRQWIQSGSTTGYNIQSSYHITNTENNIWYYSKVIITPTSCTLMLLNSNLSILGNQTFNVTWSKNLRNLILGYFQGISSEVHSTSYDWIRVRKYLPQEPTITTIYYNSNVIRKQVFSVFNILKSPNTISSYKNFQIQVKTQKSKTINTTKNDIMDFIKQNSILYLPLENDQISLTSIQPNLVSNIQFENNKQYFNGNNSRIRVLPHNNLQNYYQNKNWTIMFNFNFTGNDVSKIYTLYDYGFGFQQDNVTSRVTGHYTSIKYNTNLNKWFCYLTQYYFYNYNGITTEYYNQDKDVVIKRINNFGEIGIQIEPNKWYNLQFVYNNSYQLLSIYLNGTIKYNIPFYNPTIWNQYDNEPWTIGQYTYDSGLSEGIQSNFYEGYITHYQMFNLILSQTQISSIQNYFLSEYNQT